MGVKAILVSGMTLAVLILALIPLLPHQQFAVSHDSSAPVIQIGDCFNDGDSLPWDNFVQSAHPGDVPCHLPHDNEIYAQTQLPMFDYPGEAAILDHARVYCMNAFETYVGTRYQDSMLGVSYFYPTEVSWRLRENRTVGCMLFDPALQKLVGSVRGRAL